MHPKKDNVQDDSLRTGACSSRIYRQATLLMSQHHARGDAGHDRQAHDEAVGCHQ
ncbi:hypothetical protein ACQ4WP_08985 [Janthinobacterium sp. GB4P2]|uniref:hypothetical protein n=1 Tax=Janthinobacterium sp. GB4P2 TaxID=3424189 RepID=UPI003F2439F5